MWYVIQTVTGKELELVHTIRKGVIREKQRQEHCFVLYQECFRRRNGELKKGVELLFPSYVFVETDHPEEFFAELKKIPKAAYFLGMDEGFWGIYEEEEVFLRRLMEDTCKDKSDSGETKERGFGLSYLIRPSLVWVDKEGQIQKAQGVLSFYMDRIVKQRLRKRSVVIEIPFCGRMRRIRLGIRLKEDG